MKLIYWIPQKYNRFTSTSSLFIDLFFQIGIFKLSVIVSSSFYLIFGIVVDILFCHISDSFWWYVCCSQFYNMGKFFCTICHIPLYPAWFYRVSSKFINWSSITKITTNCPMLKTKKFEKLHTLYFIRNVYKERFPWLVKFFKNLRNRLVISQKNKEQNAVRVNFLRNTRLIKILIF